MGDKIQSVKGTRDLLPPNTAVWAAVETTARQVFATYGYREIRTPILEETSLFVRSVGETTDIVGKEMYTFQDRKGRSLSLRPESTAAVVRSFVEHGMYNDPMPVKLFYIGPQFRYERPQKGRYREFYQIGAELIGDPGPASDAELILMLIRFLDELHFTDLEVQLNTVGDQASRDAYRQGLREFLEPLREGLTKDSRRRLEINPLRILDTKDEREKAMLQDAPQLADFLNDESRGHFAAVQALLERQQVRFRIEPRLVRGLDYYTRTVFEIVSKRLGAQDAVVGGGRYDDLVAELGGPSLPAIGFAIGEDRLVEVLPESFCRELEPAPPVVVITVGGVTAEEGLVAAEPLRRSGIATLVELADRSIKAALKRAQRAGVRWVVLIGEEELAGGEVTLKDLRSGTQTKLGRGQLVDRLKEPS